MSTVVTDSNIYSRILSRQWLWMPDMWERVRVLGYLAFPGLGDDSRYC